MKQHDIILPFKFSEMLGVSESYLEDLIKNNKVDIHFFDDQKFIVFNDKAKEMLRNKQEVKKSFFYFLTLPQAEMIAAQLNNI